MRKLRFGKKTNHLRFQNNFKYPIITAMMNNLLNTSPLGADHPAYKQYTKVIRGAGDTVRSVIISANARLAQLENRQILRILSKDDMNISEIGVGKNGDGKTKTALFCVIPDNDKSYNFIVGMLYTQIFQELYFQADFVCGGRLPIHVTFMLDEFSNVALPDDFCSLLSTMRSREISSVIIIQNLAQIKALFKDTWETIPGNCDTLIYLGGNEQSTHKYISELLGKGTIDKKATGETRGRQGSSSRNYDVLGRELMTPDEVRKMDNRKCLIFIRGFDPIFDGKYVPFGHENFSQTEDGGERPYIHKPKLKKKILPVEMVGQSSMDYLEKLKEMGELDITTLTFNELKLLGDEDLNKALRGVEEKQIRQREAELTGYHMEYSADGEEENTDSGETFKKPKKLGEDTITNRVVEWKFSDEQLEELKKALTIKMPQKEILKYFYPKTTVEMMEKMRESYMNSHK